MSDMENNEEGEGGSPPTAVTPAAVTVEPRLVRMSLRPLQGLQLRETLTSG